MDLKSVSCPLSVLQTKDNGAKVFLHALIFTVNTSEKNMKPQFTPRSSHMLRAVAFEIDYGFGVG